MKYPIPCLALLVLLGCWQTVTADGAESDLPTELKPIKEKSFATPVTPLMIGILGTNWAMRIDAPWDPKTLPSGVLTNCAVVLHRGPQPERYVFPPAGPVPPPPPKTPGYSVETVSNIVVTVVGGQFAREPNGHLDVTLSAFRAGEEWFRIDGVVRLRFRGPYP